MKKKKTNNDLETISIVKGYFAAFRDVKGYLHQDTGGKKESFNVNYPFRNIEIAAKIAEGYKKAKTRYNKHNEGVYSVTSPFTLEAVTPSSAKKLVQANKARAEIDAITTTFSDKEKVRDLFEGLPCLKLRFKSAIDANSAYTLLKPDHGLHLIQKDENGDMFVLGQDIHLESDANSGIETPNIWLPLEDGYALTVKPAYLSEDECLDYISTLKDKAFIGRPNQLDVSRFPIEADKLAALLEKEKWHSHKQVVSKLSSEAKALIEKHAPHHPALKM